MKGITNMANAPLSDGTAFKQDLRHLADGVESLKADGRLIAHEAGNVARSGVAELQQGAKHAVEAAKGKF